MLKDVYESFLEPETCLLSVTVLKSIWAVANCSSLPCRASRVLNSTCFDMLITLDHILADFIRCYRARIRQRNAKTLQTEHPEGTSDKHQLNVKCSKRIKKTHSSYNSTPPTAFLLLLSTCLTASETSSQSPTGPQAPTITPDDFCELFALEPKDTARKMTDSRAWLIFGRLGLSVRPDRRHIFVIRSTPSVARV
jgi:hypothetical protein